MGDDQLGRLGLASAALSRHGNALGFVRQAQPPIGLFGNPEDMRRELISTLRVFVRVMLLLLVDIQFLERVDTDEHVADVRLETGRIDERRARGADAYVDQSVLVSCT